MSWNAWILINFQRRLSYTTTVTSSPALSIYPSTIFLFFFTQHKHSLLISFSLYNSLSLLNFVCFSRVFSENGVSQEVFAPSCDFYGVSVFISRLCILCWRQTRVVSEPFWGLRSVGWEEPLSSQWYSRWISSSLSSFWFVCFLCFFFPMVSWVDDYEWRRFAVFKYEKGQNSVLVVNREDYYKCNVENPINKYTDGNTEFKLDRSGSFFFIGGNADYCQKGQRLIVVVLAVRNESQTPTPTPSVPGNPPLLSPPSESPEGSPSPASSPAGDEHSPAPAPHGSAPGLTRPVVWVLGVGFGVSVVLGNFVGLYI